MEAFIKTFSIQFQEHCSLSSPIHKALLLALSPIQGALLMALTNSRSIAPGTHQFKEHCSWLLLKNKTKELVRACAVIQQPDLFL
jgi:hypothetical protein